VRKADNIPPSCAVVMKSGNRNFLEPCGLLRACNGKHKLYTIYIYIYIYTGISGRYKRRLKDKNFWSSSFSLFLGGKILRTVSKYRKMLVSF